jgi:hypothetical protein
MDDDKQIWEIHIHRKIQSNVLTTDDD